MKKNLMPRIASKGKGLESLGKLEYKEVPEIIYTTINDFKILLSEKESKIIAVKLNSTFIDNFELNSYEIFKDSKYYVFNIEFGINSLSAGYSDNLRDEELVSEIYELIPEYKDIRSNMINEILTISEASELWKKEVSTLRRNFMRNTSFKLGIDCRKSASTWLVTREAMERVYGKLDNKKEKLL